MTPQLTEQFFKDIGQADMSAEDKQTFTAGFITTLDDRVNLRIIDLLNEQQLAELNQLVETGDEQKIYEYKKSVVPELDAIIDEEFNVLKKEIIDGADDLEDETSSNGDDSKITVEPPLPPPPTLSTNTKEPL